MYSQIIQLLIEKVDTQTSKRPDGYLYNNPKNFFLLPKNKIFIFSKKAKNFFTGFNTLVTLKRGHYEYICSKSKLREHKF